MMRTVLLLLACGVAACKGYRPPRFDKPQTLGGKIVPANVLTEGERAYTQYCRACHGDKGDGKGPAAKGVRPPPRDFTLGVFKFAAVPPARSRTTRTSSASCGPACTGRPCWRGTASRRTRSGRSSST